MIAQSESMEELEVGVLALVSSYGRLYDPASASEFNRISQTENMSMRSMPHPL
jgi:hypothetical protein